MARTRRKDDGGGEARPHTADGGRLRVDCLSVADDRAAMIDDVRRGLMGSPKTVPAKYLYDELGAQLFDRICDQPEYYPTRTEESLLAQVADEIVARHHPAQLVELGSGASRKTRILLDVLTRSRSDASYVPVDVSEEMLRRSVEELGRLYGGLRIHGIVGDYEHHLRHLPESDERMMVFLGSTIGNFTELEGRGFLRALRSQVNRGDALLIGFDLVKPVEVLNAAYNDAAGVTAEFNRNVLRVINRELDADFPVSEFAHEAFFNPAESQIEMHLRTASSRRVRVRAAGLSVDFAAGESVRTEISRKFTRDSAERLLRAGGFEPDQWFQSQNGYFGVALALAAAVV